MPRPKAAWRFSARSMMTSSACSKNSGSRLADGKGRAAAKLVDGALTWHFGGWVRGVACGTDVTYRDLMAVLTPAVKPKATSVDAIFPDRRTDTCRLPAAACRWPAAGATAATRSASPARGASSSRRDRRGRIDCGAGRCPLLRGDRLVGGGFERRAACAGRADPAGGSGRFDVPAGAGGPGRGGLGRGGRRVRVDPVPPPCTGAG